MSKIETHWSDEDSGIVATHPDYPSASWIADSPAEAAAGLLKNVIMIPANEREEAAATLRRVAAITMEDPARDVAEMIFLRITSLPKRGNTYQVHVADLLEIMAEHGVTE